MPSLPELDCLQPRAEDTVSTPRAERAATPIGEYLAPDQLAPTTSEGALSHQFLPAMGTRVATHTTLASFRQRPRSPAGQQTQRRILSCLA